MRTRIAVIALTLAATAEAAKATLVQDFFTLKAAPATTLSGTGNTSNPSFGTVATTSSAGRMIGYFSPQAISSIGDSITMSFSMTLNDGATYGQAGDNFRFALFDRSLEANTIATNSNLAVVGNDDTDQFRGYWFGVKTGSGTAPDGSIRERNVVTGAQDDPFANASSTNLGSGGGTNITFAGAVNGTGTAPVYTGVMTLTVVPGGLSITGSFSGNGGANTFSFTDTTPIALSYSAVGFLSAGPQSIDQVNFSNIDVSLSLVPEASAVALLGMVGGLSGLGVYWRRRVRA